MTPTEKQLAIDVKEVFGGPHGLRVLSWLSGLGKEGESTFMHNDPTGTETAFNEGRRFMILQIRYMLALDPNIEREPNA